MYVLNARNVNDALGKGLLYLRDYGIREESRNGPVLVAPGPVVTVYSHPLERVLLSPLRDANPFFHFFEALWMLAGRNDIAFLAQFNKRMVEYSDDGVTQRGAYGYRWRSWFGYDQLSVIVEELKRDPASRRCVLTMWDAIETVPSEYGHIARLARESNDFELGDLLATSKDKPCNTHVYFDARGGKLNMTVLCRSNDIYWGVYGANAVHFSYLLEYVASKVGVPVGEYRQFSNNYHLYTEVVPLDKIDALAAENAADSIVYKETSSRLYSLDATEGFDKELVKFLQAPDLIKAYDHSYIIEVAQPMWKFWGDRSYDTEHTIKDVFWKAAAGEWVERRKKKASK